MELTALTGPPEMLAGKGLFINYVTQSGGRGQPLRCAKVQIVDEMA